MFTDDDRLRILAEIADAPYEPERWQAVMEGLARGASLDQQPAQPN